MASSTRTPSVTPVVGSAPAALSTSSSLFSSTLADTTVAIGDAPDAQTNVAAAAESFETAVSELDDLVQKMESGELSLEQSLAAYQRGALLVQYCQKTLSGVQKQVKILEAGLFKPFEDGLGAADSEDSA
jgi:exodeoxyribonuclease VII small subunit